MEVTEKLLTLTVGNLTVNSFQKFTSVLNIGSNNHNIYDNLGAQILIGKLNINAHVEPCEKLHDAIRYGDQKLQLVTIWGFGPVTQEFPNSGMKNMITAYITVSSVQ